MILIMTKKNPMPQNNPQKKEGPPQQNLMVKAKITREKREINEIAKKDKNLKTLVILRIRMTTIISMTIIPRKRNMTPNLVRKKHNIQNPIKRVSEILKRKKMILMRKMMKKINPRKKYRQKIKNTTKKMKMMIQMRKKLSKRVPKKRLRKNQRDLKNQQREKNQRVKKKMKIILLLKRKAEEVVVKPQKENQESQPSINCL